MLVVSYAVIHKNDMDVPCMRCFSCALLILGRIFVFGLRTKNLPNL